MMPNFTPEPWEMIELTQPHDDWTGTRFVIRAPKDAPGGIAALIGMGYDEERANAHLLLAAPELLAALEMLLADIEDYQSINNLGGSNNQSQVNARAAIAKAKGGNNVR
jgi:hypothetical protein